MTLEPAALTDRDTQRAALALLVVGHLLADFVFQTRSMVAEKRDSPAALWRHGGVVFVVHALAVTPFVLDRGIALLVALALASIHVVVDATKAELERRIGPRVWTFLLDQALHLGFVVVVAAAWFEFSPGIEPGPLSLRPEWLPELAILVGVYAFAGNGGSAIVAAMLAGLRRESETNAVDEAGAPRAGHIVGLLERWLVVTLVWLGQWGAIGFVLAAKSLARFKQLDDREFAEVYLVGTLTSTIVAVVLGLLLRGLL